MKYDTYCNICKKHKVKPTQVVADGNIADILNRDKGKDLKLHEIMLDQYLTVYYFKGKVADV